MADPVETDLRVALVLASSTGGVGRHVASLAAGLRSRGAAVAVFGPAAAAELFGFASTGARVAAVEIGPAPRPVADLRAVLELRRLLRSWSTGSAGRSARRSSHGSARAAEPRTPVVVHAHGLRAGFVAGLARPSGVPLVLTVHNVPLARGRHRPLAAAIERVALRRADVVLAASADLADRARRRGARVVRDVPVAAPPLPAPTRTPGAVRAELDAADRPLVLAVGRLHRQKGFDVLVQAAALMAARQPAPLVVLAGDGPEEDALRAEIAAAGAPVRLLGRRPDVADLLAAADVVVLPSRWEARALAAQEALAAGRPLVATAVGGIPDLVGDGALLVPAEDAAALADGVAALLDDPARARALAEIGRTRAGGWPDETAMLDQIEAVYRELVGLPAR